jgi:hypothetical protein
MKDENNRSSFSLLPSNYNDDNGNRNRNIKSPKKLINVSLTTFDAESLLDSDNDGYIPEEDLKIHLNNNINNNNNNNRDKDLELNEDKNDVEEIVVRKRRRNSSCKIYTDTDYISFVDDDDDGDNAISNDDYDIILDDDDYNGNKYIKTKKIKTKKIKNKIIKTNAEAIRKKVNKKAINYNHTSTYLLNTSIQKDLLNKVILPFLNGKDYSFIEFKSIWRTNKVSILHHCCPCKVRINVFISFIYF